MGKLLSPTFWIQTIISTFITMCMIYLIKKVATTYQIPVVSTVAENV